MKKTGINKMYGFLIGGLVFTLLTSSNIWAVDCSNTAQTGISSSDCSVLVDLYNSTNGPNWYNNDNWLSNQLVSTWDGVTVQNGHVTEINLIYGNLNGNIPASIGNLAQLEILILAFNSLNGYIPTSIGNLNELFVLDLQFNQLSGSIPSQIGDLANVQFIDLRFNQLNGPVPQTIGNLNQLHSLILNSNQLAGVIPSTLGNLSSLEYLILDTNQFTGQIPPTLANLNFLRHLNLSYNALTGVVPEFLGNMGNLEYIALSDTQLTGTIPLSLLNLSQLELLWLDNNQLTGAMPAFGTSTPGMTYLNLSYNQLTGTLPITLGSLSSLHRFAVNHNKLYGVLSPTHFSTSLILTNDNYNFPPTVSLQNNCFEELSPALIEYMGLDGFNYFGFSPQFPSDDCKRVRPVITTVDTVKSSERATPDKTVIEEIQKIRDKFESRIAYRHYDINRYEVVEVTDPKGAVYKGDEALKYLESLSTSEPVEK